jgi:hypothetical protein
VSLAGCAIGSAAGLEVAGAGSAVFAGEDTRARAGGGVVAGRLGADAGVGSRLGRTKIGVCAKIGGTVTAPQSVATIIETFKIWRIASPVSVVLQVTLLSNYPPILLFLLIIMDTTFGAAGMLDTGLCLI